jgi:hypothetical protein
MGWLQALLEAAKAGAKESAKEGVKAGAKEAAKAGAKAGAKKTFLQAGVEASKAAAKKGAKKSAVKNVAKAGVDAAKGAASGGGTTATAPPGGAPTRKQSPKPKGAVVLAEAVESPLSLNPNELGKLSLGPAQQSRSVLPAPSMGSPDPRERMMARDGIDVSNFLDGTSEEFAARIGQLNASRWLFVAC